MARGRSPTNLHRVVKARFELAGADEASLLAARARIAEAAEGALPAALAGVFDEAAGADEVLEIGRLEVDLGTLDGGVLDLEALAEATRRALARIAPSRPRASPDRAGGTAHPPPIDTEHPARRRPLAMAALDALVVYLRSGRLEPHSPEPTLEALLDALEPAPETAARLLAAILAFAPAERRAAVMRLIMIAPASLVAAVMTADNRDALAPFGGDGQAFAHEVEVARRSAVALAALADRLIEALAAGGGQPGPDAEAAPPEAAARPPAGAPTDPADAETTLAAPNAGVVLLHPFLPRLFGLCDLTADRGFRSAAARVTAARLIHYLATGATAAAEPELVIPCLLCAVPPDLPVLPLEPLEPSLLEKADALLVAAIGHWTKLGKTSPDGLRETFLARPGLLEGSPASPRIVVERRGVDVLIRWLPWGIDPVRLPWLAAPIPVDWT